MDDFEVIGDGDEVGAILNRAGGGGRPAPVAIRPAARPVMQVARPGWMHPANVPQGVTVPNEELDFLPFEPVTLTSTTKSEALIALPQRPFRGERIILSAYLQLAAGTISDAANLVVIDPAIFVGATQIGATQGSTPISTFAATAFGVRLSFPSAGQGTRIVIPVTTAVTLAAGDKIVVTGTVIGRAVRLDCFPRETLPCVYASPYQIT